MLKLIVFLIIAVVLGAFAAIQFVGQLERASVKKAKEFEGLKAVEVGYTGRAAVAVVNIVVICLIALVSKWYIVSTVIAMLISLFFVLVNTYLKKNGLDVLTALFVLWIANIVASAYQSHLQVGTPYTTFYTVFQVVMLVLMIVGTVVGNVNRLHRKMKARDKEYDELEEDVSKYRDDEAEQLEAEAKAKAEKKAQEEAEAKAKARKNGVVYPEYDSDDEDEDEDDDEAWEEEELRKEARLTFAIQICLIAIIVVVAIAVGYWLEVKFDFFPPYRF